MTIELLLVASTMRSSPGDEPGFVWRGSSDVLLVVMIALTGVTDLCNVCQPCRGTLCADGRCGHQHDGWTQPLIAMGALTSTST